MKNLEALEVDLRIKLESYVGRKTMIEEVIPRDLDDLFEIVKANPKEFHFVVKDIRQKIAIVLEQKIGMR
jgi:hypothetical protein